MAVTREQVAAIYVATFNRAPDAAGLDYWVNDSFGGNPTIEQIAASFFDSAEAQATYPSTMTTTEKVQAAYTNLFGRTVAADSEDVLYWVGQLDAGSFTQAEMLLAMQNGALGDDATVLANKTTVGLAYADAGLTGTDFDLTSITADTATVTAAQTAIDTIVYEANLDAGLTDLLAARDAVAAQEDAIAAFLVDAFANAHVEAETTDQGDAGTDISSADVIEADIADAHTASADDMITAAGGSIAEAAAAFNALAATQQSVRITTARTDLQAAIDAAQADVDTAAADLEAGVAALMTTVNTKAEALTAALNSSDAAQLATTNAETAAAAVSTVETTTVTYSNVDGVITATTADEGIDGGDDEVLILTTVTNGVVELSDDVTYSAATGLYTFTTIDAEGTPDDQVVTIEKSYLDALVAKAQAELNAAAAVTSAENALATAINAVYNAQDTDGYDDDANAGTANVDYALTYAELNDTNQNTDVIYVAGDNSVTVKYAGDTSVADADTAIAAGTFGDIDTYNANLATLDAANTALSDFNDAVTAWEATGVLVADLAALNATLTDLNTAATDALAAIENATDHATLPGLATDVLEGADNFTVADDLYLYTAAASDSRTLTGFGTDGSDKIYVGSDFSLVIGGTDAVIADNLGSVTALEIIAVQVGVNTVLYFEDETFAGNSAGTSDFEASVTLAGVTAADLVLDNGYLTIA